MSAQTLPLFLSVALFIVQNYVKHQAIETNEQLLRPHYDYIVVGSGTGGSVVAGRLSQDGHTSVLLLEAGGPSGGNTDIPGAYWFFFNSRIDWNYTQEEQFVGKAYIGGRIPENKGLVIGGSGSVNTLIYNRGNPRDFDTWEQKYGAPGWGWKDVMPYFLKFENNLDPLIASNGWHSTSGPVGITSWAKPTPIMQLHQMAMQKEFGFRELDINSGEQDGTTFAQAFIDANGVRSSASNSYIDPNPNPKNLHVSTNSFVTRLIIENKRAIGVEYVKNGHTQQVFADKEVIVSAGSINSPQLLMLSGIGPKEELMKFDIPVEADLPVGMYMQNHPGVAINHRIKDEYRYLAGDMASGTPTQLQEFFANKQGPLAQHYRAVTYSSTKNNPNRKWPNWNMSTGPYLAPQNLTNIVVRYNNQHAWDAYNTPGLGKPYIYCHTILQRPRSRGYVKLLSKNPFVYPANNPRFLTHPLDLEDMVEALSFSFKFFETSSISQYVVPHTPIPGCQMCPHGYVYECEPYLRCVIEQITDSNFHPVGSVRMGDPHSDETVLDPRLRVKGIDGLRVCDASVMPQIHNANINAAVLMIGEKCADMVREESGHSGQTGQTGHTNVQYVASAPQHYYI